MKDVEREEIFIVINLLKCMALKTSDVKQVSSRFGGHIEQGANNSAMFVGVIIDNLCVRT